MPRPAFPGVGWSFWLMPADESVHMELANCIGQLRMRYNSVGPQYAPHITLQTSFKAATQAEMLERGTQLAVGSKPLTLTLDETPVSVADNYFQALVLPVESTMGLLCLNQQARALMGEAPSAFWPHLSLVYADMTLRMLTAMLDDVNERQLPRHMLVNSVDLYFLPSNDPATWEHVKKFPFAS